MGQGVQLGLLMRARMTSEGMKESRFSDTQKISIEMLFLGWKCVLSGLKSWSVFNLRVKSVHELWGGQTEQFLTGSITNDVLDHLVKLTMGHLVPSTTL